LTLNTLAVFIDTLIFDTEYEIEITQQRKVFTLAKELNLLKSRIDVMYSCLLIVKLIFNSEKTTGELVNFGIRTLYKLWNIYETERKTLEFYLVLAFNKVLCFPNIDLTLPA